MKDIIELTKKEYERYMQQDDFIGEGSFGKVFKYNDDLALKLWFNKFTNAYYEEVRGQLKNLLNNNFSNCKTPEIAVTVEGEIMGYLMNYCSGLILSKMPNSTLFKAIIKALKINVSNLKEISHKKFMICDIHPNNIMYNVSFYQNGFTFIDCDDWEYFPKTSYQKCLYNNIYWFNEMIFELFDIKNPYYLKAIIKNNYSLRDRLERIYEWESKESYEFIISLKNYLEEKNHTKIRTLGEFRNYMR